MSDSAGFCKHLKYQVTDDTFFSVSVPCAFCQSERIHLSFFFPSQADVRTVVALRRSGGPGAERIVGVGLDSTGPVPYGIDVAVVPAKLASASVAPPAMTGGEPAATVGSAAVAAAAKSRLGWKLPLILLRS